MIVTAGATNKSVYFYIYESNSGTNPGEPVTGLLFSDIETGGSASYARLGGARVDFTLVTLASADAAHTDGGFILIDDTNMPGLYRCDVPDAAVAAGADQVYINIVVASGNNALTNPVIVDLTDFDLQTATVDVGDKTGFSLTQAFPTNFSSMAINGSGVVEAFFNGILGTNFTEATIGRLAANFDTLFENADAVATLTLDNVATGTGAGLTAQETRDAMKLAPTAGVPAAGSVDEHLDDVLADTAEIGTAGAGLTDLGGMSAAMKAEVNAEADTALTDYDGPTNAEMEARTPTAAQLTYIVANAATAVPVTFTTSGGSTTAAVLNLVDGVTASSTNNQYSGKVIYFLDGTLTLAVANITAYDGATKVATITEIPFSPTSSHTARLC